MSQAQDPTESDRSLQVANTSASVGGRPAAASSRPSLLMLLSDAIVRFVPNGSSIAMGTALEAAIPFAAGHELIRQHRHDLTLIGPISDILFDQLIGAGCVKKVAAAWVGNVSAGLAHNYRRAVEQQIPHPLQVEDYSNFTIALALLAAGLGAPFIPTKSLLGSDIEKNNRNLHVISSPLDGERLVIVPALKPDVAILHVQRADEEGNAHAWGNLGITEEAAMAATASSSLRKKSCCATLLRAIRTAYSRPDSRSARSCMSPAARIPLLCKAITTATILSCKIITGYLALVKDSNSG